jgi:hypothetical protein
MDAPNVCNVIRDEANNVTYQIYAYRELSRDERVLAVPHYLAQPKDRRKKVRNAVVKIITVHGATDRL